MAIEKKDNKRLVNLTWTCTKEATVVEKGILQGFYPYEKGEKDEERHRRKLL